MSPQGEPAGEIPAAPQHRPWWAIVLAVAILVLIVSSGPGRRMAGGFFASLRIAAPQRVSVNLPSIPGPNADRHLLGMVSAIITTAPTTLRDEQDRPVGTAEAAAQGAGMHVELPHERKDRPTLTVLGAQTVELPIKRAQLRTMLTEAGRPGVSLPPQLDGSSVTVRMPRAVRAQYGHCPAPPDTTLQGQFQGRPLVTAANADCIVLLETPAASADVPPGLDVAQVVSIALELSGLSPNQAQAFERTLDWRMLLGLSLPRFVRSFDSVQVGGAPAVLVTTAGRRGPTYEMIWAKNGVAYALAGYGSPGDAPALAASLHPAGSPR